MRESTFWQTMQWLINQLGWSWCGLVYNASLIVPDVKPLALGTESLRDETDGWIFADRCVIVINLGHIGETGLPDFFGQHMVKDVVTILLSSPHTCHYSITLHIVSKSISRSIFKKSWNAFLSFVTSRTVPPVARKFGTVLFDADLRLARFVGVKILHAYAGGQRGCDYVEEL